MALYELSEDEVTYIGAGLVQLGCTIAVAIIHHANKPGDTGETVRLMNEMCKVTNLKNRIADQADKLPEGEK